MAKWKCKGCERLRTELTSIKAAIAETGPQNLLVAQKCDRYRNALEKIKQNGCDCHNGAGPCRGNCSTAIADNALTGVENVPV